MTLTPPGPQAAAHPVATVFRDWYRRRGQADDQLLVPTFIVGDPWRTLITGRCRSGPSSPSSRPSPPWRTTWPAATRTPWSGCCSSSTVPTPPASPGPRTGRHTIEKYGARADFLGLDTDKFPHDIGFLGRYGPRLATLPRARRLWSPLDVNTALTGLAAAGLKTADGV